jgi:hypothetical protein
MGSLASQRERLALLQQMSGVEFPSLESVIDLTQPANAAGSGVPPAAARAPVVNTPEVLMQRARQRQDRAAQKVAKKAAEHDKLAGLDKGEDDGLGADEVRSARL